MFLRIGFADEEETPSIAILPFENKGAEADDFYAYGISSDLITDVTGAGLIRVASMGDIEKLDYKNLENNELAKKLFVRYVAKGTLWKMDSIFQLSMEIFDTKLSKVIYNKRWQTAWIDLAVIKDDLSDNILETLEIEVLQDSEFAKKINPDAYELYLKAKHKHKKRQSADDTEIAQDLLMKALELDENLVDAKLLLGSTYRDLSEYDKALDIYKQALSLAGKLNDEDKKASSYGKIVSIFWYKGELDSILFYQKKKYEIGVALDNKQYISQSLSGIGTAYQRKSDYDNAIKNFEKAMVVYEELDDKSGIGSALQDLGGVYTYKRDNEKALEYQKRAVAIFEELEDKNSLRWGLTVLGWTYNAQRDHENAIVSFERALPLAEELGNKRAIGDLQKNLGVAYGIKGDNVKALEYYEAAISIYDELGDKNRVAYGLKDIGWFHLGNEHVDKSLEYLKRALLILEEVGNNHGIETTLMGIGEAFFTLGDYDKAIDHYDKAKISSEERGNKSFVMWSMGRIGQVYYNMGDNEKALELFENYFSIQKEIGETEPSLSHMTYLYLTYKNLEKDFDVSEIQKLIDEDDEIGYGTHFRLYELLGDSVYLKKAYDKVQEKADDMEDELKEKYLRYPIPKAILEKYNSIRT
jgi:tetratricopeptide (TPR) repeat protein